MKKKEPIRTCVVTKEKKSKKELIRIVATKEGEVSIDLKGKKPGRGAYLTLTKEVINKAEQTKALDKKLQVPVSKEIYEELTELVLNAK